MEAAGVLIKGKLGPPDGQFISVASGFNLSCGVRIDHSVECWGFMIFFLSDSLTTIPEEEYTSVSVGGFHACGIRIDQTVACWGRQQWMGR